MEYRSAINIQYPWTENILSGKKKIETRFYPLPKKYVGIELAIVETPGKSGQFKARIVGLVTFGPSFQYASRESFYKDSKRHLVTPHSDVFGWDPSDRRKKWGWPVTRVRRLRRPFPAKGKRGIVFTKRLALQI